jgi:hypothetical protein
VQNLAIVGYAEEKEAGSNPTLGAQRSVNVKRYLTTDGPTKSDPARIQARQGGTKSASTHFYFIPEGKLCAGELESLGKLVDETKVTGSSRDVPPRVKKPATPKQPVSPSQ